MDVGALKAGSWYLGVIAMMGSGRSFDVSRLAGEGILGKFRDRIPLEVWAVGRFPFPMGYDGRCRWAV